MVFPWCYWRDFSWPGHSIAGTRRWLQLGPMSFQVSEIVKLIIILVVAAYFADRRIKAVTWGDLVKLGIFAGIPAALVALEPDLGTALTFIPIVAAGVLFAGIRLQHVAVLCLAGILALPVGWHFLRPYQRERLMTFVHPTAKHSKLQLPSYPNQDCHRFGRLLGKGIGQWHAESAGIHPCFPCRFYFRRLRRRTGVCRNAARSAVVFCSALAFARWCADGSRPRRGLPFIGLAAVLFFQVVINTGMMIGVLPITGIPLPLMSQGGSSLLFTFLGLGLAMSVRARRYVN